MKKLSIAFLTLVLVSACGGGSSKSDSGSSGGASGGNTAPSIQLTDNTFTVAEGETAIGTISATDAEGDPISFTLIGPDAGVVSIGSTSGALSFNAVTDYEAPADADGKNDYEVTVRAYDGSAADARDIIITVTNVVEAPVIISPASYEVLENETLVGPVTVSDSEGTVTYGISGADANLFAISSAGILAFKAAPDFETPGSAAESNTYSLTVEATNSGGTASKAVTVVVKDVEENSLPTDLFISEYVEGSSNNKYIEIFNGTGETVALDAYGVARCSNDCDGGTHEYFDEIPAGTTLKDGAVYTMCHEQYEGVANCDQAEFGIGFWNGNDALKLVKGTEASYTDIDVIGSFAADSSDYWSVCGVENGLQEHTIIKKERVEGNTDWAASAGTNANDCDWIVKEQNDFTDFGKHCWNSNGDDAVTINNASGAVSVEENTTAVATVSASVSGFCGDVTYALSGADAALFAVADGVVTFKAAPDYETAADANTDNVYNFTVTVTAGDASDTLDMEVTVTNVTGDFLMTGLFGGITLDEASSTYEMPTGSQTWAGIANNNVEMYPLSLAKKSIITFTGSVPSGASADIRFRFEKNPDPDVNPAYDTDAVTVTGADAKTYTIVVPAQDPANTYRSFIMYVGTLDMPVIVKDIKLAEASPYADFSGVFGGTAVNEDGSFIYPAGAQVWAGFANENVALYPFSLATGALITFKGATVEAGDVDVRFRFERLPHPDFDPAYDTTVATVSGTTEKEYSICVPAQPADRTYRSFLMYLNTQDASVFVKDVEVTPYEEAVTECVVEPTFLQAEITGEFGGATRDGTSYIFPSDAEVWGGFSNDAKIYPIDGDTLEKITFKASIGADQNVNEAIVRWRFEYKPHPAVDPSYDVLPTTLVTGTEEKEYEVALTAPAGGMTFESFLMFLNTRDVYVNVSDVKLYAKMVPYVCGENGTALEGGGGTADMCDGFGGAKFDYKDSSYIVPADSESWAGFANQATELYPIDLTQGAVLTFDASVPDGGDAVIKFNFEDEAGGNKVKIFDGTDYKVTVTGATETTYTLNIPAVTNLGNTQGQSNNWLMYLLTRDTKVIMKNFNVVPTAKVEAAN